MLGITNPRRTVEAEQCSGCQLYGVPESASELPPVRALANATT